MSARRYKRQAEICQEFSKRIWASVQRGRPADSELAALYRRHKEFGSRDRRLISACVFSHLRWRGWTQNIAHSFYLDADARHEAIDTLLPDPGKIIPQGFRDWKEKAAALQAWESRPTPPTLADAFPAWVPPELHLPEFQVRPPVWARIRPYHEDRILMRMESRGLPQLRHERIPSAFRFDDHVAFTKLKQDVLGLLEVQSLASQAVGVVCDPQPGDHWWDACCGAGGKSLHLNELMKFKGRILATDNRLNAIEAFAKRANKGNIAGISSQVMDVRDENLSDIGFDGILVDAPCTGIGTWSRNPDARWRLRKKHIDQHAKTQREILAAVAKSVRPGGTIVYAVCTLTKEETEDSVAAFLESTPSVSLEAFPHPLTGAETETPGIVKLTPAETHGDGMFIAKFRVAT